MFRKWRSDIPVIGISVLLIGMFFIRLWLPKPGLFMIPEFGLSDVLHTHFPGRQYVSIMLKENQWPLWTPDIGTGFPIFAEGLVGVFYLPNLLLFRFLPAVDAYNLSLAVSFLLSAIGTYWFSRQHGLTRFSATVCGLTFAFAGYFSVQLNHANYVQAASLLPLVLAATARLRKRTSVSSMLLFSLLFSQQLLTGGFQFVWITGLVSGAYLILWTGHQARPLIRRFSLFFCGIVLAVGLAAMQLVPTLELLRTADRSGGLSFDAATAYPYPLKHVVTFVSPYFFGSPADGTYPPFSDTWGLFWENTGYIGRIPLILGLCSLLFIRRATVLHWWGILGISFLLVLGKNSPLYFIFAFPVFSSFRVPSRFLIVVIFCLVCLFGYTIDRILSALRRSTPLVRRTGILCLFMVITAGIVDELRFSYEYPPVTPARWWTQPEDETAQVLDTIRLRPGRIFTVGSEIPWNDVYLKTGWKNIEDYRHQLAYLRPNANVLFSIPSASIYVSPGIAPKRLQIVSEWMKRLDTVAEASASANVPSMRMSRLSEMLLRENNVSSVLSPFPITFASATSQQEFIIPVTGGKQSVYLTHLSSSPRARLAFATKTVRTVEEIARYYTEQGNTAASVAVIEDGKYALEESADPTATALITDDSPLQVTIQTTSTAPSILILADSYYPGWQATDNGAPTEIFPVNLSQRGVYLKEGSHQVQFFYKPQSFEVGKRITFASGALVLILLLASRIARSRT